MPHLDDIGIVPNPPDIKVILDYSNSCILLKQIEQLVAVVALAWVEKVHPRGYSRTQDKSVDWSASTGIPRLECLN